MLAASAPAVPSYSGNLGVANTVGRTFSFVSYLRAHSIHGMETTISAMKQLCRLCDINLGLGNSYPPWEKGENSVLAERYLQEAAVIYDKPVSTKIYHAGLECGLIIAGLGGNCDAISFGPEIRDLHTPEERMCVQSYIKTWELLQRMLCE